MKSFRIISLCPSTTETLIGLGLANSIVGRTIFCIHPQEVVQYITKVGGTKNPKFDKIRTLNPTHIMFNMEENDANHLQEVRSICKTIVTTPVDIKSTIDMLDLFGREFFVLEKADKLIFAINQFLEEKRTCKPFSYLYFIWNEPKMIVGKNTYIDEMLSLFGGKNEATKVSSERYITLENEKINVDKVFLSSEPFPFKEQHKKLFSDYSENIDLIDGEMVSWHGSRTLIGLNYLASLFEQNEL
jgi:iron complex transport system substrate-binding protein